jgi:uncharacterized protein
MNTNQYNNTQIDLLTPTNTVSKTFLPNVFMWMFLALSLTAFTAYYVSSHTEILAMFFQEDGRRNLYGKILMFLPLVFVIALSAGLHRFSYSVLAIIFTIYAIINGISFSYILIAFTSSSITSCFIGAASIFAVMAVMGYKTKQDLTKFGSLLMAALIGMIIMSIINFFMKSSMMDYVLGAIGVAIFTGLTAYDMQKLKNIGNGFDAEGNEVAMQVDIKKYAIIGALNLYLDFINIFISLLRLFGKRN